MTLPYPLYEGKVGSPQTVITEPFTPGTDSSISVADLTVLPSAPNRVTIIKSTDRTFVTVTYTGTSVDTTNPSNVVYRLTGVAYEEGTAQVYPAESIALRNYTHADDWDTKRDVSYLDTAKVNVAQGVAQAGKYLKVGVDGNVYPAAGGGGGGTSDYNDLANKPQIAGITLSGNKSLAELGIASSTDLTNKLTVREGTMEIGNDANGTYIWT